jgi:hypothetical protein
MSVSAIITMVVGMILIWGGLITSIIWARRTGSSWSDD